MEAGVSRLDDEARTLFEWLAVFAGGFDAGTARAIRGPAGPAALAGLVDASLVTPVDDTEPAPAGRFAALPEPIRRRSATGC